MTWRDLGQRISRFILTYSPRRSDHFNMALRAVLVKKLGVVDAKVERRIVIQ